MSEKTVSSGEGQFTLLASTDVPVRAFKAGETIFREGDPATELYVVQTGTVHITLGNRLLITLGAHGIFGEMALIDGDPRSATATAVTDVTLIPVSERQFLFLVRHTPFFALQVMRVLASRLRTTNIAL
jgi:CRP/FNR family transcriptional regulator, cyclic AMP receptor protein